MKEVSGINEKNINPAAITSAQDAAEVPFGFDELFFSRTDTRGIIMAGNSVFQRVSLYSWDEVLRKPHNIIRHPEMPKAVFFLLWDFLKRGKPIGAYVKNRAKDGRYYWVFAIATPVEGGYLSVRLKPSGEIFKVVQNVYKELLSYEKNNKVTPAESAAKLMEDLKSLGFASYEEFMSVAVNSEMSARDKVLGNEQDIFLSGFGEIAGSAKKILEETAGIFSSYEVNKYVPLNLQVQSFRLGEEGKTIGVISGNYNIVSAEIRDEIAKFRQSATEVFDKIYEGQFLISTARIQREVIDIFNEEADVEQISKQNEMAMLQKQQLQYQEKAKNSLEEIIRKITLFQEDCTRMSRCASSLEVIRVMGKVDAARLSTPQGGLHELINDLKTFQMAISESIQKIEEYTANIKFSMQVLLKH